jgi:hypothetical protein
MTEPLFLDDDQLQQLTGRKIRRCQIDALRTMGVPFRINAAGKPVVCRSAIEGRPAYTEEPTGWTPRVIHGQKTHPPR